MGNAVDGLTEVSIDPCPSHARDLRQDKRMMDGWMDYVNHKVSNTP